MIACKICGLDVKNNLGGQLTNHLKKLHSISLEEYTVQFSLFGIEPRCACGLCEERPHFRRGSFSSYALEHDKFEKRKELYVQKFGQPLCLECGKESGFYDRAIPKSYCSPHCSGKNTGFSLERTQQKIKESVVNTYGVENVSKLESVKKKISNSHKSRIYAPMSQDARQKISNSIKERWKKEEYRIAMIKAEYSSEERKRRSLWLKKKNLDPLFRERIFLNSKNRLTKLHKKIRDELDLSNHGFVSEQRVLKYFVDELNEEKKVIVEIYGDHPHANPNRYKPDDLIRMVGQTYTASEKWETDKARKEKLEKEGYNVFVIWESDNLQQKKLQLESILYTKNK